MNVKIQGGGSGVYANAGSCTGITTYLQHEDLDRMKEGKEIDPFFNQERDKISGKEVTYKIDNNKAKLSKSDAKFYVIIISPSKEELAVMGTTPREQAGKLKEYIRKDVMQKYAEGFGKGLKSNDMEYYAKIHYTRDKGGLTDMHAHIIVSRKDRSNTKKLSPQTNHTGKKNCGNVKGGGDRSGFFQSCEECFDKRTVFYRDVKNSYQYRNAIKNGTLVEIREQVERAVLLKKQPVREQMKSKATTIDKLIEARKQYRAQNKQFPDHSKLIASSQEAGDRIRQELQQLESANLSVQPEEGMSRRKDLEDEIDNNRQRKKGRDFGMI